MAQTDQQIPINIVINGDYVAFTPMIPIETQDAIDCVHAFFPDNPVQHALWDFRDVGLSNIPAADYGLLVAEADKYAAKRGPDPRTAIVVTGQFDRMVVKVFLVLAEQASEIEFCMFSETDPAVKWLNGEE